MGDILEVFYSLPFGLGLLLGVVGQRSYCYWRAWWLNKYRPNPDGTPHHAGGLSMSVLGGFVALAVVGYVLLQVSQTEDRYRQLADSVAACQIEFNDALLDRAKITGRNDELSRDQRNLLAELDELQGVWINRIITPPPEIAALDPTSPRRQAWNYDVTHVYADRSAKLRAKVADITEEQDRLAKERGDHPLPEPTCGHHLP